MSAERIDIAGRRIVRAAKALLDAYGGDTPDWIRDEAMRLDAATDEMDEAIAEREALARAALNTTAPKEA